MGRGQIFAELRGVANVSWAQLPGVAKLCCKAIVEAPKLEFAHMKNRPFGHIEADCNCSRGIVKARLWLDRTGKKSARSVELLNVLQIVT